MSRYVASTRKRKILSKSTTKDEGCVLIRLLHLRFERVIGDFWHDFERNLFFRLLRSKAKSRCRKEQSRVLVSKTFQQDVVLVCYDSQQHSQATIDVSNQRPRSNHTKKWSMSAARSSETIEWREILVTQFSELFCEL